MRRRVLAAPLTALSVALVGAVFASPADAGLSGGTEVVGDLVSPLSVAVDGDGTVYVSQNFAGVLTKVVPGDDPVTVFSASQGTEVGAVSVVDGFLTFATTTGETDHLGRVWQKDGGAAAGVVLNTTKYEKQHNPDAKNHYGFFRITKACRAKAPKMLSKYPGLLDSHPYGSAMSDGVTYIADAGGNDILSIAADGTPETVGVLPPTKIRITKAKQQAAGLPKCTRGGTFRAEPVPTDVEVGPDGNLYVTSLPGGPEDGSLGANGRVYRVNPTTGDVTRLPGPGLVSPTGIAIAPDGTAYISMLFAGLVMRVPLGGSPQVFASVPAPGDVDWADGQLYVTQTGMSPDGPPSPGSVVQFPAPAGP